MATFDRSKKKWVVRKKDTTGRIKKMSFTEKSDATEYEVKLARDIERMKSGLEPLPVEITFGEYVNLYFKKRNSNTDIAPTTVRTDASRLQTHWISRFKDLSFRQLNKNIISDHLDELITEKKLSPASRNRNRALIHHIVECAIRDGRYGIKENPVSHIPILSENLKTRKVGFFETEIDVERYIQAAYEEGHVYGTFATIALYAGPRVGEAIALRFKDVDFNRKVISVNETYQRGMTASIAERTKGQRSGGEYALVLLPRVEDAILEHKALLTSHKPNDFILQDSKGSFMSYFALYKAHKRIVERAGLKYITIHDLRRTYASMADDAGLPRGDIQATLGHKSINTTNIYIRKNLASLAQRAMEAGFGNIFTQPTTTKEKTTWKKEEEADRRKKRLWTM